jgi:hypothetical protein
MTYPNEAGHRGVDTSAAAAAAINADLPQLQRMVRDVIAKAGPSGVTGDEIAAALGWNRFRVRPRTSELRTARRIVDSGRRRKNPASGISAIVWVLPEYKRGAVA